MCEVQVARLLWGGGLYKANLMAFGRSLTPNPSPEERGMPFVFTN